MASVYFRQGSGSEKPADNDQQEYRQESRESAKEHPQVEIDIKRHGKISPTKRLHEFHIRAIAEKAARTEVIVSSSPCMSGHSVRPQNKRSFSAFPPAWHVMGNKAGDFARLHAVILGTSVRTHIEDRMFGICIVTFASEDVIAACLDSLQRSLDQNFRVVILDNGSVDRTCSVVVDWAEKAGWGLSDTQLEPAADGMTLPEHAKLTLLRSDQNLGFAGGVNQCLLSLMQDSNISLFWVLNPDSEPDPGTIGAYQQAADQAGEFGLMGGRTIYHELPNAIQSDGGRVGRWTGICRSVNQGKDPSTTNMPPAASLDYISGANVVASRAFLAQAGLMQEDYFLFYEEVDWAQKRGSLPLILCQTAIVHHHGGTSIGSGSTTRRASAFANYFNYRNRMKFVWRFRPYALPVAYTYSSAKIVKLLLQGAWREAVGAFRGLHQMSPPSEVLRRISWPPPNR